MTITEELKMLMEKLRQANSTLRTVLDGYFDRPPTSESFNEYRHNRHGDTLRLISSTIGEVEGNIADILSRTHEGTNHTKK